MKNLPMDRRSFIKLAGAAACALGAGPVLAAAANSPRLKLGLDNFSVRAMGWKAPELLDYAASLRLDTLLISDLDAYASLETPALRDIKARADSLGLQIHAGTWSICPSSKAFKSKWGSAAEHLALGLRVARDLGSPVLRCVLGTGEDRKTPGGIAARIADTVKVCKACRAQALDFGVKIAIENHAGDMQGRELVELIEAAGPDTVGATFDSGNATWALEDPIGCFTKLAPYTVSTGMRDSMVWEDADGAKVQWTAMGEGQVDWKAFFAQFAARCPEVPVNLEIISGFARAFPYLRPDFWQEWPKASAADLAPFLAMARRGKELPSFRAADRAAEQAYQKSEVERSVRYCREVLGLGRK